MKLILIPAFISLLYFPASQALTLNGFTNFETIVKLNARVSGIVQSIAVKSGQRVKKGDVLIQLDATPYQARLDKALALEKSLLPVVQTAQLELERAEELYDRDSLSQVALKTAENVLTEADASYQAAIADKILAEYQLKNAALISPINGYVLQVHTNVAQFVNPVVSLDSLITLATKGQMKAIALIKSEQWNSLLLGKIATVELGEKIFTGKVSYLGYKRVKQTDRLPAYEIHVSFEADQFIPAEMPVTINIKE